jgi:uncharacterized membrane protein
MRGLHILAGAVWIGGGIFYLVVIIPALRLLSDASKTFAYISRLYQRLTQICIAALLLSGGFLTFDRLSYTELGLSYMLVLGIKIALALFLFGLAFYIAQSQIRKIARKQTSFARLAPQLLLILGVLVFLLGSLLNTLFEQALIQP